MGLQLTPKEQAVEEAVRIRARREELGQADRPWNTPEAMKEWVRQRIIGIQKEHAARDRSQRTSP